VLITIIIKIYKSISEVPSNSCASSRGNTCGATRRGIELAFRVRSLPILGWRFDEEKTDTLSRAEMLLSTGAVL